MAKPTAKQKLFTQIGRQIARCRVHAGMTQVQMAQELGVSQSMITAYETGKRCISIARLVLLAHILHTSTDEILNTDNKELLVALSRELIADKQ